MRSAEEGSHRGHCGGRADPGISSIAGDGLWDAGPVLGQVSGLPPSPQVEGRQKAQSHCRKKPPAQDRDPWGTRPHKLDRENTAIQGEEAAKHFACNT